MKLSKRLLSKTVALASICATMATAAFAAPQGTFDTSEIQITGQASRSVAPSYAILTLGITSQNTNINAAKSNNDRIMSDLISRLANLGVDKKIFSHRIFLLIQQAIIKKANVLTQVTMCPIT